MSLFLLKRLPKFSDLSNIYRYSSFLTDPSFGLNSGQTEIYNLASEFGKKELRPYMKEWDSEEHFPVETIKKAASLGFSAIYCDTEYGGSGFSRFDASLIFEGLSQGCVSTTAYLTIHNMVSWMIGTFGSDQLKQKYLPPLIAMDLLGSYCLTEPGSGSDAASLSTTAKRDGDDFVLNGSKMFISGAGVASVYLVMCRTGQSGPKGISCFLVEKETKGLSFGKKEAKMGWNSQPTRAVIFENCRIPATNLIGKEGEGFSIAMKGLNGGRINIASCSLGGAQAAFDITREYLQVRKQFGHALSEQQGLQFIISDMATALLSSRALVRLAAKSLDQDEKHSAQICAAAKLVATEKCSWVCDRAVQLHGGYGYLKDYDVQQYFRDLRVHQILEGTNQIMRVILARHLLND